jgi:hypothetical protein
MNYSDTRASAVGSEGIDQNALVAQGSQWNAALSLGSLALEQLALQSD